MYFSDGGHETKQFGLIAYDLDIICTSFKNFEFDYLTPKLNSVYVLFHPQILAQFGNDICYE